MKRLQASLTAMAIGLAVILTLPSAALADEKEDAAKAESAVKDYEERIEALSGEIASIRKELEDLTREMLEGETGTVYVFFKGKVSDWSDRALQLSVDGKTLFARPLSPAELNVLGSDLPLELLETRLGAGEHEVAIGPMGEPLPQPVKLKVKRAEKVSWTSTYESGTSAWQAE